MARRSIKNSPYFLNTNIQFDANSLWGDGYVDRDGKRWTAIVGTHILNPETGEREGIELWKREDYRSQDACEKGMEAAFQQLVKKAAGWGSYYEPPVPYVPQNSEPPK